jgi:hypothetical protein
MDSWRVTLLGDGGVGKVCLIARTQSQYASHALLQTALALQVCPPKSLNYLVLNPCTPL